jgi:hypothetical protein
VPALFTVAGTNPVAADGSQDTHAQAAGASCDATTLTEDRAIGRRVAEGFTLAGFPVSASLLEHFLAVCVRSVEFWSVLQLFC